MSFWDAHAQKGLSELLRRNGLSHCAIPQPRYMLGPLFVTGQDNNGLLWYDLGIFY